MRRVIAVLVTALFAVPAGAHGLTNKQQALKEASKQFKGRAGKIAYGFGVGVAMLEDANRVTAAMTDSDGIVRATAFGKHEFRPAFTTSYLWAKRHGGIGFGPMLSADIELKGESIDLGHLGIGFMVAFRSLPEGDDDNWLGGFGVGIVYSFDTAVPVLRGNFSIDAEAPMVDATTYAQPQFLSTTGNSIQIIAVYSLGKATAGMKAESNYRRSLVQ